MAGTRELSEAPGSLGLSLRAAAALLPGASALPFVAGGGDTIPDTALALRDVRIDHERLAAYARVCGFAPRATMPGTAPHVLAFPLHMALMTDGSFPFAAVGLVHTSNRIQLHRAIPSTEALDLLVRATPLVAHAKGRSFTILSEARVAGELVWEERSTMLRRGGRKGTSQDAAEQGRAATAGQGRAATAEQGRAATAAGAVTAEWQLGEDLGRRYAAVSGDRNPIHMHALSARLFGFPKAIAHGMWTKARCLAELSGELPDSYTVEVDFRRPILLPGRVAFSAVAAGEGTSFGVRGANHDNTIHLEGTVTR